MRRTLLNPCVALAAFAASCVAVGSFERAVAVPADLVAAPAVRELTSLPAPHTMTCAVHGFEMSPQPGYFETMAILSQKLQEAYEHPRDHRRLFPNCFVMFETEEQHQYSKVYQIYSCDGCRAAYRRWQERRARWR